MPGLSHFCCRALKVLHFVGNLREETEGLILQAANTPIVFKKLSMGWSKAQWIQGKWLILLTEALLWVSRSWRVCLFPEVWAKADPTQAGSALSKQDAVPQHLSRAQEQGLSTVPDKAKQCNIPPGNPVRSKRGQGQRQEWRQGYNVGPESIQEGLPKTMVEGRLQGGSHPGVKLCTV